MIKLFFTLLALLIAASFYTYLTEPAQQSACPLIEWKTDGNPERQKQVELFEAWLRKYHSELPAKPGHPPFSLIRNTSGNQSVLIQSVSGVGGDLLDGINPKAYGSMGLLKGLSSYAEKEGFGPENTYPGVMDVLSYDGEQFAYPCNCTVESWYVNRKTFQDAGLRPPSENWTPEEFTELAGKFVKKANQGAERQTKFIFPSATSLGIRYVQILVRSQGLDLYNETQTKCTARDPRFTAAFQKLYDWTYKDHILPTAAEEESNAVEPGGYGGAGFTHFICGNYAMIHTGRYGLIRFRTNPRPIPLDCVPPPQYKYRNMVIRARSTGIYAGTRNFEKARYFMQFLAGKEYNDSIIEGSDGLPPNPKYCRNNPEFLHPSKYPNEGNIHANELRWAETIAIPEPTTPYYPPNGQNWFTYAIELMLADRATAQQAVEYAQNRMDLAMAEVIRANPKLAGRYRKDSILQQHIDLLKKDWKYDSDFMPVSGTPVPKNWIRNPYYRKFYADMKMLGPEKPVPLQAPKAGK